MKLKYYMRGLGVGILLATLVFSFSNHKKELTDDEIIKKAEKLGMVHPEEDNSLEQVLNGIKTTGDDKDVAQAGKEITTSPTPEATPEETLDETSEPTPEATVEPTPEATAEPTPDPTSTTNNDKDAGQDATQDKDDHDGETITVKITEGMSSGTVSILLRDSGVIDNDKDFNKYMISVGKVGVIRVGTYSIPVNASYEDIAKIITKK